MNHVLELYSVVSTILGLLGLAYTQISKSKQLPDWLLKAKAVVGDERVRNSLEHANEFINSTPEEKRVLAAEHLKAVVLEETGRVLSTSEANALVEIGYQSWRILKNATGR